MRAIAAPQKAVLVRTCPVRGKKPGEFGQGELVDPALELDHGVQRHPVVVPTPGVELRDGLVARRFKSLSRTFQLEQEPNLLLALVVATRFPPDVVIGHLVPQPIRACAPMMRTCSWRKPTSSWSSRYIACSGVSPYLMPPCGNCQECVRMRLPQNTWLLWLSRMMPTLGLKPSRSSIINLE